MANKRVKEENRIKKLQRKAKLAKPNYWCNGDLPIKTDWDAVLLERNTNRFYQDKLCKGHNTTLASCMCKC
jgi:hypothetical protein